MPTFDIPAEIALVKAILAHPAGYDLDFGGGQLPLKTVASGKNLL